MIISAIFQLGLGITIINRITDQQIMVKKEMKLSFLNYGIQSDVTQRWNSFQSEVGNHLQNLYIKSIVKKITILRYFFYHKLVIYLL